jgi:hypothetical protein
MTVTITVTPAGAVTSTRRDIRTADHGTDHPADDCTRRSGDHGASTSADGSTFQRTGLSHYGRHREH